MEKSNIHIVNLGAYTTPRIVENYRDEFVCYGEDNNYFKYLIDRYTGSTTNQSIITGISKMIYGKGIDAIDSRRKPEQYAQMIGLFIPDDLRRVIFDRKLLGMAAMQVTYKSGFIETATHFPMETLRPEKADKDGNIKNWYYHPNWGEKKPSDELTKIPSFGTTKNKSTEIIVLKPYIPGHFYFSPCDYQAGLPYAVLEEEIGDYLINDVKNGFSGTKVINFNNGTPDPEKMDEIKNDVIAKLTGATGQRVIVAFNDNAESKTTVEDLPLDNAPDHYTYLSTECEAKLIVAHRITSPLLIGVKSGNAGLGNNADEIKTASLLQDSVVIRTYQEEIIEGLLEPILKVNDVTLKLYFKTVQPLDFVDTNGMDTETKEEQTGVKMESHNHLNDFINKGEEELEGFVLIDERDVIEEDEQFLDEELNELNQDNKSLLSKLWQFIKTGTANPNAKSEQDKTIKDTNFKVRYSYSPLRASTDSRDFCKTMVNANKLYRKEDIIAMESVAVNPGWGPKGVDTYSIWKYKGGGDCHHSWKRKTFMSTTGIDTKSPNAPTIGTRAAEIKGYTVRNDWEVSVQPQSMPNRGFLEPR